MAGSLVPKRAKLRFRTQVYWLVLLGLLGCVHRQPHPLSNESQEPEGSGVGISMPPTPGETEAPGAKSPRAKTTT